MKKKVCILSIDGGGVRGIIPAVILTQIQKRLREKDGPDANIIDYVDLVAGSSTGGLLACGMLVPTEDGTGKPKYTPEELVDIYEEQGDDIFHYDQFTRMIAKFSSLMIGPAYDDSSLLDVLHSYFNEVKLSQSLKPCLITAYDIEKRNAKFFTSLDAKRSASHDFYLRDVARATSAAPSYFTPAEIKSMSGGRYALIDGGVFANNPAICALTEARKINFQEVTGSMEKPKFPQTDDMFILSLGTGYTRKPYKYEDARNFKVQNWVKPIIDMLMSSSSETVSYQLKKEYDSYFPGAKTKANKNNYIRMDINLSNENVNPDMADASEENIDNLKDIAFRLADDESELLDIVVEKLRENKA